MTPQIVERVDAWLARAGASPSLEKVWRHLRAIRYSSSHVDAEDAIGAAMRGVLLELVREVWGRHVSIVCTDAGWAMRLQGGAVGVPELTRGGGHPWHLTEDEALVVALEAAPRREGS